MLRTGAKGYYSDWLGTKQEVHKLSIILIILFETCS